MRKLVFLFTIVVVTFISCKKEVNPISNSKSTFISPPAAPLPDGIVDKIFINFPDLGDVWCGAQPLNCFEVVVIVGYSNGINRDTTQYDLYNTFVEDYNDGNIVSFFINEDWGYLFPYLPSSVVEEIISDNYQVFYNPSTSEESSYMFTIAESGLNFDELGPDNVIYATPILLD